MSFKGVFSGVTTLLRSFLLPILAFYNGVLWSKDKASKAQVKANEKVNEIHNRVRKRWAERMRDKE